MVYLTYELRKHAFCSFLEGTSPHYGITHKGALETD